MAKKRVDELLLSNHVKHAGSHNKVQEEKEMWKQRVKEKDDWSERTRMNYLPPPIGGHLVSDMLDVSLPPSPLTCHSNHPKKSTKSFNHWRKKLFEYEENNPIRWGHSGYKDHHPEEFASTGDSSGKDKICHRRTRKRKKRARLMDSMTKKIKYEKEKREKRTILTRKKRRTSDCSSSSEGSDDSSQAYEESQRRRRRREKVDEREKRSKQKEEVMECGVVT